MEQAMNTSAGSDELLMEALRVLKATKLDAEKNGFKYGKQAVVVKTIRNIEKYCEDNPKYGEPLDTFLKAFADYMEKHKFGVYKCR